MAENARFPIDKTALSYWLPKLEVAGIPVPQTIIIDMPLLAQQCVCAGFDGNEGDEEQSESMHQFLKKLSVAIRQVGLPAFLRTDHTSAKHSWTRSCYLTSDEHRDIGSHVFQIAEFSECCDIMGLPWERWAVREFLLTKPLGTCPRYGDMPVCREFRFFIADGAIRCWHPYWPQESLERGGAPATVYGDLCACCASEISVLRDLAQRVANAIEGAWSVDILETERRGWRVTDMAEAHKSFHWEGCEAAK